MLLRPSQGEPTHLTHLAGGVQSKIRSADRNHPGMPGIHPNTEVFGTLSTLSTVDGSLSFQLLIVAVVLLEGFLYKFEGNSLPPPGLNLNLCRMVGWHSVLAHYLGHPERAHGCRGFSFPTQSIFGCLKLRITFAVLTLHLCFRSLMAGRHRVRRCGDSHHRIFLCCSRCGNLHL